MDAYNIYEKINFLEKEIFSLKEKIGLYESILQTEQKTKMSTDDNLTGFYTVTDILLKYRISRQCLYNYRKHVLLKKSGRIGRFERFKKNDVHEFMQAVTALKAANPKLFIYDSKRTAGLLQ